MVYLKHGESEIQLKNLLMAKW